MSEDTPAAKNNEEISKEKRIAEGIFNLIKDIELLDENNIDEELFNRFSFYINQIDEVEETEETANLVYEELGNLLNEVESNFENLEEEKFRVYEIRNRNFLILLAKFIERNKHINKKFFYELTLSIAANKNILLHSIYRESSLGNFLDREKYAKTKTNDILWICQTLDGLCEEVEKAKFNESQNLSDEKQYLNFSKGLWAFALRKEFISEELFYDLIFGKLAYDNELCDFAVFLKRVQKDNINFSNSEMQNGFEEFLYNFCNSDYATNFNIAFGKLVEIYSFAQRKFGAKANKFTNYFFKNLSFEESLSFDVNSFVRGCDKWSILRIIRNNNLSADELIALSMISQKCWFWNRYRISQRLLLKDYKGESGLEKLSYVLKNLPSQQVPAFIDWVIANIYENGFTDELWTRARAQNDNFVFVITQQQEELLQLVPQEYKNEFRESFQDINFRRVCQTPQAIKNLLTITEVCSLSLIEYINSCLRNGVTIEDIRIALDTFDMSKIFGICPTLNEIDKDELKIYEFAFLNNWILFVNDLDKIDNKIVAENKNILLQYPQIACNLDWTFVDSLIGELIDKNSLIAIIGNSDKLFSKECMEHYREKFVPGHYYNADNVVLEAHNYLQINDNSVGTFSAFQILAEAKFSESVLCKYLQLLQPKFIAKILLIVEENDDLVSLKKINSFLNRPESKNLRDEVTKIIIEEAFENNNDKVQQFYEKVLETFYIFSKKSVLELYEFFQVGLDINKITPRDFNAMESLIDNVNDKDSWRKKFVEFTNSDGYKKDFVYQIKNFAEDLNKKNSEKEIYDFLNSNLLTLKEAIVLNLNFISEILLLAMSAEKLAIVCIVLMKFFYDDFARDLSRYLTTSTEVTKALTTDENKPKLEEIFDKTEIRA